MKRAFVTTAPLVACGLLLACSFTSLDYLQAGAADGGGEGSFIDEDGHVSAEVTTVTAGQTSPTLLAQDAENLYWVSDGQVMTVVKAGGVARWIGAARGATSLAVDPSPTGTVFFTAEGKVIAIPKAGAPPTTIFTPDGGSPPAAVLADEAAVYVLEAKTAGQGGLLRMAKDGSGVQPFTTDPLAPPTSFATTATDIVWGAVDQTGNLSFTAVPKTGGSGPSTKLALDTENDFLPDRSALLAANETTIFWSDGDYVYARDRQASSTTKTLYTSDGTGTLAAITIDDKNVYAIDTEGNAVVRVPMDGNNEKTLGNQLSAPTSLVVDGTFVYLTVGTGVDGGSVVKLAK